MTFDILIKNIIKDINDEIKKEENSNYIKYEILNQIVNYDENVFSEERNCSISNSISSGLPRTGSS